MRRAAFALVAKDVTHRSLLLRSRAVVSRSQQESKKCDFSDSMTLKGNKRKAVPEWRGPTVWQAVNLEPPAIVPCWQVFDPLDQVGTL